MFLPDPGNSENTQRVAILEHFGQNSDQRETVIAPGKPVEYVEHVTATALSGPPGPVEAVWTVRADAPDDYLVLPDGRADLIIRCRIDPGGGCRDLVPLVVGPSSLPHRVDLSPGDGFAGIRFRPGRIGAIGRIAALTDRRLQGNDAVACVPSLSMLRGRAASFDALINRMLQFAAVLPDPSPVQDVEAALDRIHRAGGRIQPGPLAAALGIGPRRLHRLFVTHVGLPPLRYATVVRFQRAVRLLGRGLSVAAAAHEAGYADQPHMTRAFRRLGGFTPSRMPGVTPGSSTAL